MRKRRISRVTKTAPEEAVQRGAGDGWLDVLPISPCPAPLDKNVVVDVSTLVPRDYGD